MTLEEAIKHCEKKVEECERDSHFDTDYVCYQMSEAERKELRECASEHRQLAEWLRKLKAYEKVRRILSQKRIATIYGEVVLWSDIKRVLEEVNADE